MKRWIAAAVFVAGFVAAGMACAEPGLGNKVYDPYVKSGVTELEVRGATLTGKTDGGNSNMTVELERGLNDRVSFALLGEFERAPGGRARLDSVGVEAVVYLGTIPHLGVDTGLYLEYEQRVNAESGVGEGKLLFAKTLGSFQGLLNLAARKAFTDKPGEGAIQYGYAASATWETLPNVRVGVEAFGDLGTEHGFGGRQAYYVGPKLRWETRPAWLPAELELEASYLFAAGAARNHADGQARLLLEFERRF